MRAARRPPGGIASLGAGGVPRLEPLEHRLQPSTFTVVNANDRGPGSLRDAITRVNADTGTGVDVVAFHIATGPLTIALQSALQPITHPVRIDGTTQPGFTGTPLITFDGSAAGSGADGLTLTAGHSLVRGLAIDNFNQAGILIQSAGGDVLRGNYLGTDATGKTAQANAFGVEIDGTSGNTIGGTTPTARNVISANAADGVEIFSGSSNRIEGNRIGTDVTGTRALGNGSAAVQIDSSGTTVGGAGSATPSPSTAGPGCWPTRGPATSSAVTPSSPTPGSGSTSTRLPTPTPPSRPRP